MAELDTVECPACKTTTRLSCTTLAYDGKQVRLRSFTVCRCGVTISVFYTVKEAVWLKANARGLPILRVTNGE